MFPDIQYQPEITTMFTVVAITVFGTVAVEVSTPSEWVNEVVMVLLDNPNIQTVTIQRNGE